jgi:ketosteroid isomerase-like protein
MSQENVEVLRRGIGAYNRRDFDALRVLNHPEVEVDWSASRAVDAGVYRGQDEVFRLYQMFFGMFERISLEPDRFIEADDSVVVPNSVYMRGRHGRVPRAYAQNVGPVSADHLPRCGLPL